jgi:hypothetical protein
MPNLTIRGVALRAVLLGSAAAPWCSLRADDGPPAGEFLRGVVAGELKAQADDHSHWAYQVKEEVAGRPEVRRMIETAQGNLDRLQSVGGRPIPENQAKREQARIRKLVGDRDAQRKLERAQAEDDRRTEHLFRVLPQAVLAMSPDQALIGRIDAELRHPAAREPQVLPGEAF